MKNSYQFWMLEFINAIRENLLLFKMDTRRRTKIKSEKTGENTNNSQETKLAMGPFEMDARLGLSVNVIKIIVVGSEI